MSLWKGNKFKNILPEKEQNELFKLMNQGNKNAKEIIFEHNMALVAFIINRYYYELNDDIKEELFSVGCIGLVKAINNYDISFNNLFSTYAFQVISGDIKRYISDNKFSLRVSRSVQKLSYDIKNIQNEYSNKNNGNKLSPDELAKMLGVSTKDIIEAIYATKPPKLLNDIILKNQKDDDPLSLSDVIPDPNSVIYEDLEKKELYSELMKTISELSEEEKIVIISLFGLNGNRKTQQQLASMINKSQSRISNIKIKVLKKLKDLLQRYIAEEYESGSNKFIYMNK